MIDRMTDDLAATRLIAENVRRIREQIADAALSAGRSPEEITLMAVTKTRTPAEADAVIAAGVKVLGENRVQEAREKKPHVARTAEWHLIGHLQTNKVKHAVELFAMIQSVDSLRLAEKISGHSAARQATDVLIEVNTSGEESKFGVAPEAALDLVGAVRELPYVRVRGLMTIGAFVDDERRVRSCFAHLRRLWDDARAQYPALALPVLSMGMTNDFPWAIAEGSTMVRLGTAIFGPRA